MRPKNRVIMSLYVPIELRDRMVEVAEQEGRSLSNFITKHLKDHFLERSKRTKQQAQSQTS
jgi:hypothetical protein